MKKDIYQSPYRTYRTEKTHTSSEQKIQIIVEETDLLLTLTDKADKEEITAFCYREIREIRNLIKCWVTMYPQIQHSLEPVPCPSNAPLCIQMMCKAGQLAHVGPFAAVAGTVAQFIAAKLHAYLTEKKLPSDVIAENGGDIFCCSEKERIIGILANPKEQCTVGIKLKKEQFPLSICSSSATIGHSLSFGNGDLAVVLAKNASLADALATRYGNLLKSKQDINIVLEQAKKDSKLKIENNPFGGDSGETGVSGVFLQIDGSIGAWGEIELTAIG